MPAKKILKKEDFLNTCQEVSVFIEANQIGQLDDQPICKDSISLPWIGSGHFGCFDHVSQPLEGYPCQLPQILDPSTYISTISWSYTWYWAAPSY